MIGRIALVGRNGRRVTAEVRGIVDEAGLGFQPACRDESDQERFLKDFHGMCSRLLVFLKFKSAFCNVLELPAVGCGAGDRRGCRFLERGGSRSRRGSWRRGGGGSNARCGGCHRGERENRDRGKNSDHEPFVRFGIPSFHVFLRCRFC